MGAWNSQAKNQEWALTQRSHLNVRIRGSHLTKVHQTGGWVFTRGWAFTRDNTVPFLVSFLPHEESVGLWVFSIAGSHHPPWEGGRGREGGREGGWEGGREGRRGGREGGREA